jgi:hypothetical protein
MIYNKENQIIVKLLNLEPSFEISYEVKTVLAPNPMSYWHKLQLKHNFIINYTNSI